MQECDSGLKGWSEYFHPYLITMWIKWSCISQDMTVFLINIHILHKFKNNNKMRILWNFSVYYNLACLNSWDITIIMWDSYKNSKRSIEHRTNGFSLINIKGILSHSYWIPVENKDKYNRNKLTLQWQRMTYERNELHEVIAHSAYNGLSISYSCPLLLWQFWPHCHPRYFTGHRQIHIQGAILPLPIFLSTTER